MQKTIGFKEAQNSTEKTVLAYQKCPISLLPIWEKKNRACRKHKWDTAWQFICFYNGYCLGQSWITNNTYLLIWWMLIVLEYKALKHHSEQTICLTYRGNNDVNFSRTSIVGYVQVSIKILGILTTTSSCFTIRGTVISRYWLRFTASFPSYIFNICLPKIKIIF